MSTAARSLLLAQIEFFAALAVCVLLDPSGLGSNHGWSYYGARDDTIVPYLLGFLVCILLVAHAATLLERSPAPARLPAALRLLALLLLFDVATPDTLGPVFYWAHDVASTVLFLFELGLAGWLVLDLVPSPLGLALLGTQFAGGLVAMFSQLELISLLGPGILVFQVSFGLVLVATTARFHETSRPRTAPADEPAGS